MVNFNVADNILLTSSQNVDTECRASLTHLKSKLNILKPNQ